MERGTMFAECKHRFSRGPGVRRRRQKENDADKCQENKRTCFEENESGSNLVEISESTGGRAVELGACKNSDTKCGRSTCSGAECHSALVLPAHNFAAYFQCMMRSRSQMQGTRISVQKY